MHDEPPPNLVDLLARLRLAKPEQVRAVRPIARTLARGLPLFESVWVDALVQSRLLTPYQGSEINAGRGEHLSVGPYVLRATCGARLGWAESFVAAHRKTKLTVHLLVASGKNATHTENAAAALRSLLDKFDVPKNDVFGPPPPKTSSQKQEKHPLSSCALNAAGADGQTLWAAFAPTTGVAASQWISWHGRFSSAIVLEIARQTASTLAKLEAIGIAHGDIAASSLMLSEKGEVQLTRCAVRSIFRPVENQAVESLPIEAFDYLAPERLTESSSATSSHDIYACGCLWWHLLTGRSPLAGGDHAAKLVAVRSAKVPDVRRLAPDVPKLLADVIERCTKRNPAERPASFADIAQLLGPSTSAGRRKLADALAKGGRRTAQINWSWRARSGLRRSATQLMATAACLVLLAAATWPLWRSRQSPAEHTAAIHSAAPAPKIAKLVASAGVDPAVRQANYQSGENPRTDSPEKSAPAHDAKTPTRNVIELAGGSEIAAASLRLQPGTIVRGKGDQRPRIVTPANGLAVTVDNVRFENCDFLWRQRPETIASPDRQALVELRSSHAEFVGCTFQAVAAGSSDLPPAVRLVGASQRSALAPASQVRLERCTISGVACGVDCAQTAPAAIEVSNTLHLGRGALVRFSQPRRGDAPAVVTLEHVTVRGAASIIEINAGETAEELALLSITANGCVLAPENGGLLTFTGRRVKASMAGRLRGIEWQGGSSLTPPGTPVAIWWHDETNEALSEEELSMDGLVASAVEFIGTATDDPANSRLKKWAAPLQSEEAPGIADDLPKLPSDESAIASAATAKQK